MFNLGFEPEDGEAILDIFVEWQESCIKRLDLQQNPEFWEHDSNILTLIRVLDDQKENLEAVELAGGFPFDRLIDLPQNVQDLMPDIDNELTTKAVRESRMDQSVSSEIGKFHKINQTNLELPDEISWASLQESIENIQTDSVFQASLYGIQGDSSAVNQFIDFIV